MKQGSNPPRAEVVIVGGGYTGAAAAMQLANARGDALALTIVEPREELGRGIAYSTRDPDHRLNGPLDNHLLDPARPDDLREWCMREGVLEADNEAMAANGGTYIRRGDFGRYVDAAMRKLQAHPGVRLRHHRSTATGLERGVGRVEVLTEDGARLAADLVVIATGNGLPVVPGVLSPIAAHPRFVRNPFDEAALPGIAREARVLLVGSGLTAFDIATTLLRRGHSGPIHALSRHGVQPAGHRKRVDAPSVGALLSRIEGPVPEYVRAALASGRVRALSHALRERIAATVRDGGDWQVPFDEVRNAVWRFWPELAVEEKRRFLRHLRIRYDTQRFRVPPQNERVVCEGQRAGLVSFHAGRLRSVEPAGDAIRVTWEDRATGREVAHAFDAVINCTGLDAAFGARANPFLANLLAHGLLRADPSGLGFEVDRQCRPLGRDGRPSPKLRMVGPPTAGSLGDPLGVIFIAPQIRRMLPGALEELGLANATEEGWRRERDSNPRYGFKPI